MRIAFDYQTFTLQTYGGISRYFVRLAQEFLAAGEQVRVFAPLYVNAYLPSLPSEWVQGKRLNRYPPKSTRFFTLYNRLASRRAIQQWRPDIVHETYYAIHGSASKKKCQTVITVYDMIHELFAQEFPPQDKTAGIKKIAIDRADHVICISENTKKDLIQLHGIASQKISVVLLGFDQFATQGHVAQSQPSNQAIDADKWRKNFVEIVNKLASHGRVVAACHTVTEEKLAKQVVPNVETYIVPDEHVAFMNFYAGARFAVVNRVHAGFMMASLGKPAAVIGNDSRALMIKNLNLTPHYVEDINSGLIDQMIDELLLREQSYQDEIEAIRTTARSAYVEAISKVLLS